MKNDVTKNQTYGSYRNKRYLNYQLPMQTYDSFSYNNTYTAKLPSNFDVLSELKKSTDGLSNLDVKRQTINILSALSAVLHELVMKYNVPNSLTTLNIIEQNDSAALIEWNYQNFRVGFSVEPIYSESSYYIVSEDKSTGSFTADSKKIGTDIEKVVTKIVEYVIRNT